MPKSWVCAALAAVLGLFLVACGAPATPTPFPTTALTPTPTVTPTLAPTPTPTASPTPTTIPTATPVPSPSPTATPEGKQGGTLRLAVRAEPPSYDVHQEFSAALATGSPGLVYSRLLRFQAGPQVSVPNLMVECEVCQSWEQPAADEYVFHLREGVRWHNISPVNGRELTAEDVVFSYRRQQTPGWPNAGLLRSVQNMELVGSRTFKITLVAPDSDFLISLADGHSKIVAPEVVAQQGDLTQGPNIGTGPWIWERSDAAGSTLLRNPDYFEAGLPYLDKLALHIIPDEGTRWAAFSTGRLDAEEAPRDKWLSLQDERPELGFFTYLQAGTGLELAINTQVAPFDRLPVREAVFKALDPWATIDAVWSGQAEVTLGMPVVQPDWMLPRQEMEGYFNDPAAARQLLADALGDRSAAFDLTVGDFGDEYLQHAQRVAEELEAVGFQPNIRVVNLKEYAEEVWLGGNYAMYLGATSPVNTPNMYFLSVLHGNGRWNTHGYLDPEMDHLIEQQALETDEARRTELVQEIQRRAFAAAIRFMPATRVRLWAMGPSVRNFYPNFATYEYFHWARVWLEE